ncbi:MAG: TldD/PmbA family protein [Candidatus Aminicenantes bacterium]|nr:MAG: TldD/PmbA family protein [Candidatus Aminicenantes bacterium]
MKNPPSLAFEDHFNISLGDLQKILDISLSRGGDFSEIYLEYKIYNFINMEEDIIKETAESISLGLGIRVLSGEKTGYGYTNDLSFEKIKKTALTAATIASSRALREASPLSPVQFHHNFYPVLESPHKESLEKKISFVKETYHSAQNFDRKIKKVKVSFLDHTQFVTILNSEGLKVSDVRPLIKLACLAIAEKKDKRETGFSGGGGRVGMEYFSTDLTPKEIGQDAAKEALELLEAALPPAGEMPVVLAPGHSGVLVHEAVGHLLEADFIRKKTSIFWNKMGKKVGSSQVTIYDDPTIPYFRGSYNIDDEGTIPKKTLLIERGKMAGLLQDRLSAKLMRRPLTGHGRRQDYSCIPIPRMSNTYIDRGKYSPDEIIKSVEKGFYAHKFLGGQVEDSGKFTFSVSSGYLIENGKLTAPVKQATLIGTNIDILKNIEMIGSDLKFGLQTGTCGKEGQAVPVIDGCPTIKISRMTVGGR